ncbi:zinc-binding alcohol dehydrogenase family protein [Rhodococcus koreensis]|uniref:quinone oxidoreductase family protein n=1 Tax=Rhodococcus koreensis TaxID=99653 RepID=UPI00366FA9A3
MRAIQLTEWGGPEVLQVREVPDPTPGPGQQVFEVLAAGVNYADTHTTEGAYIAKQELPVIPGGEVLARDSAGRRVLGLVVTGGYAERIAFAPEKMIPVPDEVSDAEALACLVQGATAWHMLRSCAHLQPGETVVVNAAAGGVGTMAVQLAKHWGAGRVIATASTPEKRQLALDLGADVAIDYTTDDDLTAALRDANNGKKVDVVLDATGGPVFDQSLAALAPLGRLVLIGISGHTPATPIEPGWLLSHSVAVIGLWLFRGIDRPGMLSTAVSEMLELVATGKIKAVIGGTYPLERAADAHHALRDRASVGKLVLDLKA